MSKRLRYKPVRKNERLDLSLALSQASTMLDEIALYALAIGNNKLMLEVADRWIAIGSLFSDPSGDDDVLNTNDNVEPYGFGGGVSEVNDEDE